MATFVVFFLPLCCNGHTRIVFLCSGGLYGLKHRMLSLNWFDVVLVGLLYKATPMVAGTD